MSVGPAQFFSFREHDLDGAKAAVGKDFFTTSMDLLDRKARYDFRFDGVVLGALAVGVAHINAGLEIGMADLEDSYYVNYSASGSMHARHRGRSVEVTPGWGAVYHPIGPVGMTTSDQYGSYAVRITRSAVNEALEEQVGLPLPPDPVLEPHVDLRTGPGRRWDRLVRLLCDEARTTPSVLSHPMIAAPLHDAVVAGFLHATEHRWRDALARPVNCWSRTPVRRAVEAIRSDPTQPFTPTTLARLAGTPTRTLHDGFRRHLDTTPMDYLRLVRLERAHAELRAAEPHGTTVAAVAHHWGFGHVSRFSQAYARVYGRPPGATLRDR
ncbi:AraC family transcriptional regulator [Actinomycetospora sp. TBRC 11914]|uniref:AraC family transcriptional regulator n=1 Tax=Actinomycetospora sp. TBRC 11914 TaxID=2729387 RepID=UPI00145CB1AC|nr:AraC family transcriptional regulator [Actinomycetospora sp. TBRC 11914]NMO88321.1 AraC family transcriptional regulator [Actinomycetospora sp. TBRC 11914]